MLQICRSLRDKNEYLSLFLNDKLNFALQDCDYSLRHSELVLEVHETCLIKIDLLLADLTFSLTAKK